jgi:hypothetical protein
MNQLALIREASLVDLDGEEWVSVTWIGEDGKETEWHDYE